MLCRRENLRINPSVIVSAFMIIIVVITMPIAPVPAALVEAESVNKQEEQPSKSLHKAALAGDLAEVKRLIAEGADVNKLESNSTALHIAVSNNRKDIAELLLEKSANIDIQDETGRTALYIAVQNNNIDLVKILLSAKADINIGNNRGQTPIDIAVRQNRKEILDLFSRSVTISTLHAAVKLKNMEKVKEFLDKGADVNEYENGDTPLLIAVNNDSNDIAKLLLEHGADPNIGDEGSYTPLYYAIWNSNKDMVNLLISKGAKVNFSASEGDSILYEAVWMEDFDIVKALVDNGAKYDVKDEDGSTALYEAASQGSIDMVKLFLSKGIDKSSFHMAACAGDLERVKDFIGKGTEIDSKDEVGWTALFWAVTGAQKEVVNFLMDKGADINAQMGNDGSVLHQAALSGDISLVELFLSKGMNVNLSDQRGFTPIYGAASEGHLEIVKLLISKGAYINIRNRNNVSIIAGYNMPPLYTAVNNGHKDIVEFLIEKGAAINFPISGGRTLLDIARQRKNNEMVNLLRKHGVKETLFSAVSSGNIDEIKRLISEGANLEARDDGDYTALIRAVPRNQKEIIEFLLDKGADIEAKQEHGATALACAAYAGNTEMAEFLIEHGANIEAMTLYGESPLCRSVGQGHIDTAALLISKGANINTLHYGITLVNVAMMQHKDEMLKFLITKDLYIPPIHVSSYIGELTKVREYLSQGINVNLQDKGGFTPLQCAVLGGHKDIVDILLSNGAEVDLKDKNGLTPLFLANTIDMAVLLLGAGANPKTTNMFGNTMLHRAVNGRNMEIIELLLSQGVDVNSKAFSNSVGWAGWTPFHVACRNGNLEIVQLLIAHGADINLKTEKGETPLSLAQAERRTAVVRFLQDYRSLIGKKLPELNELGIKLSPVDVNDKKILVCFFDIEQRPSRNCISQLTERAGQLKQKNVITIAVQASEIEQEAFNNWIKENKISFSAGILTGKMEEKLREWGVQAMPWLILTDPEHVVIAEGFSINDLDEKINTLKQISFN
ncbi:MAG: ankyrin repeat domain-containing protein [Sedimentisphaerales bacterium]|nr:ankyrin repeat domain-containing protein [Sedimentisphaerales bacterium]